MASTKKIKPVNPATPTAAPADEAQPAAARKTAIGKFGRKTAAIKGYRKTARKTSMGHYGG